MFAIYSGVAFTVSGTTPSVAANATIEVRREDTGALASIFSDEDATTPITNPSAFADSNGRFQFYAAGLDRGYSVKVTKDAFTYTLHNQAVGKAAQQDLAPLQVTGLKFPATQVPSADPNTLDDYEEADWTPSISFGGAAVGQSYGNQTGTVTKIGRIVIATYEISFINKGSSTGDAAIDGLPYTPVFSRQDAVYFWQNLATSVIRILGVYSSGSAIALHKVTAAATDTLTALTHADINNNSVLQGTLIFYV